MDTESGPESGSEFRGNNGSGDAVDASAKNDVDPESAQRWKYTEELFFRALDCPAAERQQKLIEWCGEDVALRGSVLELLAADCSVEELISTGAPGEPVDFLERENDGNSEEADHRIGQVLGAFRIEKLLGRGGMGVVYLGERVSGGFTQKAAVKLVGRHLRSSPAVAQFLVEREILARLEHANIARLLDGGVTSEGFPYVVMEYVEGRRLDKACDDPATSIDQILRWVLQLCDAVGYVHRNLILHRDLKPGNVMVTSGDLNSSQDVSQVKLLDFGTLKQIGPEGDTDSPMTRAGMRPVTIRYASPEHIEGTQVSTAADVYSLGMILYRLIAGQLPEGMDELPIGLYLELLKEGRFKPPSQVAIDRATEGKATRKIDPQVARDLDAIVAKAIRYEAGARYPTTNALAEDIWSVLLHRPVSARDGTLRYRATKFYQRYRWPILASAAAIFVLVAGLGAMAWQGHIAHLQELRAEKGVEDERQLAHMLLFDYFDNLKRIPGSVDAQRKAVTRAVGYLDSLTQIAPGSALELDAIHGYTDLGNLQGNPYEENLGNVPEGIGMLTKAVSLAQTRYASRPRDVESTRLLVSAQIGLGSTVLGNGDAVRAEGILLAANDEIEKAVKDTPANEKLLLQGAAVTDSLGDVYDPFRGFATANPEKSVHFYLEANRYDEVCMASFPKNHSCSSGIVLGEYKIGSLIEDADPELAAVAYRRGLDAVAKFPPERMKETLTIRLRNYMLARLGIAKIKAGHVAEGEPYFQQAREGLLGSIAKDKLDNRARFDLVAHETDMIEQYERLNRQADAARIVHEALDNLAELLRRSPNNLRWQIIQAKNMLAAGRVETKLGHRSEGDQLSREGLEHAVKLAQSKEASPQALDLAADALIAAQSRSSHRAEDAHIALAFAQRADAAYAKPTVSQFLTLAKAQAAVGDSLSSQKSARFALAGLPGPVKSAYTANQIAQARELIAKPGR